MKKLAFVFCLTLLAACVEQPYVLTQSPERVEICSGNQGVGSLIGAAQRVCSQYGKTAELIQTSILKECYRDNIFYRGHIQEFTCKGR